MSKVTQAHSVQRSLPAHPPVSAKSMRTASLHAVLIFFSLRAAATALPR